VGLALDTVYSWKTGRLPESDAMRVLSLLKKLDMPLYDESYDMRDAVGRRKVFAGLEEFREHLGGKLTILLLKGLGEGEDVHSMDEDVLESCIQFVKGFSESSES